VKPSFKASLARYFYSVRSLSSRIAPLGLWLVLKWGTLGGQRLKGVRIMGKSSIKRAHQSRQCSFTSQEPGSSPAISRGHHLLHNVQCCKEHPFSTMSRIAACDSKHCAYFRAVTAQAPEWSGDGCSLVDIFLCSMCSKCSIAHICEFESVLLHIFLILKLSCFTYS
jgi:hypothetical protein